MIVIHKLTILGVGVNSNLTAADHVSNLLATCSSLLYALRVLRSHGLPNQSLKDVFQAIVIGIWEANVLCASVAWILLCFWLRATWLIFTPLRIGYAGRSAITVTDMFSEADDVFFRKILYNKTLVLHSYLPDRPKIVYALRTRSHNKSLICKSSDLNDRNFLVRAIYKDCY